MLLLDIVSLFLLEGDDGQAGLRCGEVHLAHFLIP